MSWQKPIIRGIIFFFTFKYFKNKLHGFLILQPSNFISDVAENTFYKSIDLGRVYYGVSIQFLGDHTRCFSIALKEILSLPDRHKIFTSDWLWIEVKI